MSNILAELITQLNTGALRVVDLTQPLSPQTPLLPAAIAMAQYARIQNLGAFPLRRSWSGLVLERF